MGPVNVFSFIQLSNFRGRRENRGKTGVKLAYRHAFAPVFTSGWTSLLLVRLKAGQEDVPP